MLAAVAPVAQPDHRKLDTGVFHCRPVDLPLMGGYVHAGAAVHILQKQIIMAVVLEIIAVIGVPVRRNRGIFRLRLGNSRFQDGLLHRLRLPDMLNLGCFRVLIPEHIGQAGNQHHSQQHRRQQRHNSHHKFRTDPTGAGAQLPDHRFLLGISIFLFLFR